MENQINIGELDTLVMIRRCVIGKTEQAAKTYTFTDYGKVYAKVDRTVNELVANTNLEAGDYIQLTIYKITELTTRWRVEVDGTSYEITGIDPISRVSPLCVLSLHSI